MPRDKESIIRRLKRIEGQIRGIQGMIDEDRYCLDIITQISAVRAALDKVGLEVLDGHARGCLSAAIKSGHADPAIDELMEVLGRFLK